MMTAYDDDQMKAEKMETNALAHLKQTAEISREVQRAFVELHGDVICEAAKLLGLTIQAGGKILILGNGGSAADAQHMAAELVGRMLVDRKPLPAIALTTDSSNLTAIGNDYGYDQVFVRQVQALAKPQDIVLALSTSGNSVNVLKAVEAAKGLGLKVIGLTGGSGGKLGALCDVWLNVSQGQNSCRIQEAHIFAIHSLVDLLDRFYLKS